MREGARERKRERMRDRTDGRDKKIRDKKTERRWRALVGEEKAKLV